MTTPVPAFRPGHVLLAEDSDDNQILISAFLRKQGMTVTVAENGAVAVEKALAARQAGTPFDLILMDMQMPMMDGYKATAALREQGYAGSIVALTANTSEGEREPCFAAGCNDFLGKPVDRAALYETLARFLPIENA